MADQDLRLHASLDGGPQTAAELTKIAEAQNLLNEATRESADASKATADASGELAETQAREGQAADGTTIKQRALNQALGALSRELDGAAPGLAGFVNTFLNMPTILGAAVAGITLVLNSLAAARREFESVTEAMRKQQDAANDLIAQRRDLQQQLEDISDLRTKAGGFSAEESEQATQTAKAIRGRFSGLKDEAIAESVGTLGDAGLTEEELAQAAALIQTDSLKLNRASSSEGLVRQFRRAIDRGPNRQRITDILARETTASATTSVGTRNRQQIIEAALQELVTSGSNANIQEFIQTLPGFEGEDPAELARIVQGLRGTQGSSLQFGRDSLQRFGLQGKLTADALRGQGRSFVDLETQQALLEKEGISARPETIRLAETILNQLQKARPIVVNNTTHHHNGRYFGPDAASYERRTTNGIKGNPANPG